MVVQKIILKKPMSNKQQTAVEYLIKEFSDILGVIPTKPMQDLLLVDAVNKAKKLEKQQIIDAFVECWKENMPNGYECKQSAEYYYNEIYGDDK